MRFKVYSLIKGYWSLWVVYIDLVDFNYAKMYNQHPIHHYN